MPTIEPCGSTDSRLVLITWPGDRHYHIQALRSLSDLGAPMTLISFMSMAFNFYLDNYNVFDAAEASERFLAQICDVAEINRKLLVDNRDAHALVAIVEEVIIGVFEEFDNSFGEMLKKHKCRIIDVSVAGFLLEVV